MNLIQVLKKALAKIFSSSQDIDAKELKVESGEWMELIRPALKDDDEIGFKDVVDAAERLSSFFYGASKNNLPIAAKVRVATELLRKNKIKGSKIERAFAVLIELDLLSELVALRAAILALQEENKKLRK